MKNILSLQQLKVKENTKLMAKSSKSTNCKTVVMLAGLFVN